MMNNIPVWAQDAFDEPTPNGVHWCEWCDEQARAGQDMVEIKTGEFFHEDCFRENYMDIMEVRFFQEEDCDEDPEL